MPIFEKTFIDNSFANRKGKGTHRAVQLCQRYLRKYRYYVQFDIIKYFPSIDHAILKACIRQKIKCVRTLELIDRIIDGYSSACVYPRYFSGDDLFAPLMRTCGIPIGNLTSQYFANIFLSAFDRYIIDIPGVKAYIRYVDDGLVFFDDVSYAQMIIDEITVTLASLRLNIHHNRSRRKPCESGIHFLGYRLFRDTIRVSRASVIRARRTIGFAYRNFHAGTITPSSLRARIHGWLGHVKIANAYQISGNILQ